MPHRPLVLAAVLVGTSFFALHACSNKSTNSGPHDAPPYKNPALPMEQRAADLVSRMTLDEKIAQMQMDVPAIDRLGIPAYHWWNEGLHGVARNGAATVFPQAIGLAATWDTDLHYRVAKVIGVEGRAKHHEAIRNNLHGINTGLDFWSPNINIFRDPRWGRGQETYGEDPYLTGRFAVAFCRGLQGDDPTFFQTIATPKHFAVHSGPETERHRFDAVVSDHDLFETYLPAFEAAVREGRAYSIMGAYNRLDGVPCCANPRLLDDILRKTWGFEGYIVSDVDSIADIYQGHQTAGSAEEAAAMAVKAGCDLNSGTTYAALQGAVRMGMLKEADIDRCVKRLMLARLRLGMFDEDRKCPYADTPYSMNDAPAHEELARQAARESMVLLKNDAHALPLKKDLGTIAVIGPTANDVDALVGNYNGTPARPVTLLQGIRNAVSPTTRVLYDRGCPIVNELLALEEIVPAGCLFTDWRRTQRGLRGDYFKNFGLAGRPNRTRIDPVLSFDWSTPTPRDPMPLDETFSVRWTGVLVPPESGVYQLGVAAKDGARIYIDDKLVTEEWSSAKRRSVGAAVMLEKGKTYDIEVQYFHEKGDAGVELRWTRPGGEPFYAGAVRAAERADAVIMVLGLTSGLEREQAFSGYVGFYGGDRQTLDLPAVQQELLERIVATKKPVILVLTGGSALAVNWAHDHVPAIVQAWYPGEQGGNALADILFGDYNPAGRLPITIYRSTRDLPSFEDYSMKNRTYRYFGGTPLYPFGHGLSYSTFEYAPLIVPQQAATTDNVLVRVPVKNTSSRAGDEVVQHYIARQPASEDCPRRSLQGFARLHLNPGEEQVVEFTLSPHQLSLVDASGNRTCSAGDWLIQAGGESATGPTHTLHVTGSTLTPAYQYVAPRVAPR